MKHESAKTLAWTAGALLVLALVIMSPTGAFALTVLASLCAAIPSVFAARRLRTISAVLLIASLALAVSLYPAFERDYGEYTQRAKERAAERPTEPTGAE